MQAEHLESQGNTGFVRFLLKGFGIKRRASQVYTLDKQPTKCRM